MNAKQVYPKLKQAEQQLAALTTFSSVFMDELPIITFFSVEHCVAAATDAPMRNRRPKRIVGQWRSQAVTGTVPASIRPRPPRQPSCRAQCDSRPPLSATAAHAAPWPFGRFHRICSHRRGQCLRVCTTLATNRGRSNAAVHGEVQAVSPDDEVGQLDGALAAELHLLDSQLLHATIPQWRPTPPCESGC